MGRVGCGGSTSLFWARGQSSQTYTSKHQKPPRARSSDISIRISSLSPDLTSSFCTYSDPPSLCSSSATSFDLLRRHPQRDRPINRGTPEKDGEDFVVAQIHLQQRPEDCEVDVELGHACRPLASGRSQTLVPFSCSVCRYSAKLGAQASRASLLRLDPCLRRANATHATHARHGIILGVYFTARSEHRGVVWWWVALLFPLCPDFHALHTTASTCNLHAEQPRPQGAGMHPANQRSTPPVHTAYAVLLLLCNVAPLTCRRAPCVHGFADTRVRS